MNETKGAKAASLLLVALAAFAIAACTTAPKTESERAELESDARATVDLAHKNDPSLARLMNEAVGYAVFPTVGKGAIGIGGAYGKGVLFENGGIVGYCDLTQATIGLQLGGQAYSEIIVFEDTDAITRFKQSRFEFGAQASAVALRSGVGANAKYTNGVAVFTMDEAGLMYEASIGGQRFDYESK